MTTLIRSLFIAAILGAGGAAVATAQDVPTTGAQAAQPAETDAQPRPARVRADHGGRHDGRHHSQRGARLGTFGLADGRALFAEVDANGDGSVMQDEIDTYLDGKVDRADANADGALDLEEFAPLYFEQLRPRMVDAFQMLDADGSGQVTPEELDTRFGDTVARLDRDDDGSLTLQDGRRSRK